MKKGFILLVLAVFLTSCNCCQPDNSVVKRTETSINKKKSGTKTYDVFSMNVHTQRLYLDMDFVVIVIDSCEYIISREKNSRGYMAHKGNCKYCAKRRQEEIRKVIREEGLGNSLWSTYLESR